MNNDLNNIQGTNNTTNQPTNQGINQQRVAVPNIQPNVNSQNVAMSSVSNMGHQQNVNMTTPQRNVNPQTIPSYTNVNPQPMSSQNAYQQNMTYVNKSNQTVNHASAQDIKQDPMSVVSNLNKEEAMEEALSHTTQYSPFEIPKQEVNQEVKKGNKKSAYIFIGIIFLIMLLFIIFLPQISKLFGW